MRLREPPKKILVRYVVSQIKDCPMSRPRRISDRTREAFRVDSEAEGDHIMIGGWEILDEATGEKGRWFAIELHLRNAPWAYLKGDPFRNIASVELCAVPAAVMLFGDKLVDVTCKNRLTLTASTDNLGNTQCHGVGGSAAEARAQLELGWVPKGQNEEADALTNQDLEASARVGGF